MPDDDAVIARLADELEHHAPLTLVMRASMVLHVCGLLQLALRHPHMGDVSRRSARFFIDHARAYFADCPTALDVLRRGDNPSEDR